MSTRVVVDPARCEGHAQCIMEASSVFELDDGGYARVLLSQVDGTGAELADNAARACPAAAIALHP